MAPPAESLPTTRAIRQLPEPTRGWVGFTPRRWRGSTAPWTHVAGGELLWEPRASEALPEIAVPEEIDDLLYLPPVDEPLRAERDRQVEHLVQAGVPLLVQHVPGEAWPEVAIDDKPRPKRVIDLVAPLLAGDVLELAKLPADALVVWPLIAGLTDHFELWDEGFEALGVAGVRTVLPVVVDIAPRVRRLLAEGREDHVFDALFHGQTPSERPFARRAHAAGLQAVPRRLPTGDTPRQASNRRLAGELALAADLWLRLDRPVAPGQALLRAARGAEQAQQDLAALARERNLKVLDWLDARSIGVIQDLVASDHSRLLEALEAEYLGDGDVPEPELPTL